MTDEELYPYITVPEFVVEYNNDCGMADDGFWEWWIVTNGELVFRCDEEGAANWLCHVLNDWVKQQLWPTVE